MVDRRLEGSLRREYEGRSVPSHVMPLRPETYSTPVTPHDLGPYSRAPTPQSEASTSRLSSFVDRFGSTHSSSSTPQGQPRHHHARSASPLVPHSSASNRMIASYRPRGQPPDLGAAAAGNRLRSRTLESVDAAMRLRPPNQETQLDVTPLGLVQSAPWPDVPLSPKSPETPLPSVRPKWASHIDLMQSVSLPDDESVHSDGCHSACHCTPVLPKGSASFYVDSAARQSGDLESLPQSSGCCGWGGTHESSCTRAVAALWHYMSLVYAELPLRKHREWTGAVVPYGQEESSAADNHGSGGGSGGRSKAAKRRLPLGCFEGANDATTRKQGLEERYANNRKRRRLVYALRRRKSHGGFKGCWDRLSNELFISGELVFDWSTPSTLRDHIPWFTAIFLALNFITFAYMAGDYVAFLMARPDVSSCDVSAFKSGPHALWHWVIAWEPCHVFAPAFLTLWGAKFAPAMQPAANWWRWLSSLMVQDSFVHLGASTLLFGGLALHLERRYGTTRTLALALIAGLAGNFLDSAAMDLCAVVLSGAGCAFGLLGPFIVDIILNFDSIRYPVLRIVGMSCALACFIVAACLTGYPYRLTPLSGFIAGLFPGMLCMPHVKSEKYEWTMPFLALFTSFVMLVVLPVIVYAGRFPNLACA